MPIRAHPNRAMSSVAVLRTVRPDRVRSWERGGPVESSGTQDAAGRRVTSVVEAHRRAGRFFSAGGVSSFVRDEGDGPPVVLVHGLPASSFLYRKVIPELAGRGLRALAFDLPGLGLADRPTEFDYGISGLARFAGEAVDALGLDRFHLVVHDAGGPVGFGVAAAQPERIVSLTVLNTVVTLGATRFPGEWLARSSERLPAWMASRQLWRAMMLAVGVRDRSAVPAAELDAYRELALLDDGGAAYLRIMSGLRAHGPVDCRPVIDTRRVPYPVQLIWGAHDPLLSLRRYAWPALRASGLSHLSALPARHFLQEDQAPALGALIGRFALDATVT